MNQEQEINNAQVVREPYNDGATIVGQPVANFGHREIEHILWDNKGRALASIIEMMIRHGFFKDTSEGRHSRWGIMVNPEYPDYVVKARYKDKQETNRLLWWRKLWENGSQDIALDLGFVVLRQKDGTPNGVIIIVNVCGYEKRTFVYHVENEALIRTEDDGKMAVLDLVALINYLKEMGDDDTAEWSEKYYEWYEYDSFTQRDKYRYYDRTTLDFCVIKKYDTRIKHIGDYHYPFCNLTALRKALLRMDCVSVTDIAAMKLMKENDDHKGVWVDVDGYLYEHQGLKTVCYSGDALIEMDDLIVRMTDKWMVAVQINPHVVKSVDFSAPGKIPAGLYWSRDMIVNAVSWGAEAAGKIIINSTKDELEKYVRKTLAD